MHDYHAHTNFSGDCNFSMEEMIKGALKNNCSSIAFTDHIDYDFAGDVEPNMFEFDHNEYFNNLNSIKKIYNNDIRILSGVEMGIQPHLIQNGLEQEFPFDDFDFIILSLHTSDRKDLHDGSFFKNKTGLKAYKKYYEELLYCVENFNSYNVLGHLNLIDRYSKYLDEKVEFSEYSYIVKDILENIIKNGKGLEINTSGFRYGMNSFLPNRKILKLYKDLGGKIITFGSDTHCPSDVLKYYEISLKELLDIGINEITHFNDYKEPYQVSINNQLSKIKRP